MSTHTDTQERNNESWVDEQRERGADCSQQKEDDEVGRKSQRDDQNVVSCMKDFFRFC